LESNWRYNVALAGLAGTYVRLYARVRGDLGLWLSNYHSVSAGTCQFWYWPDPEQLPIEYFTQFRPGTHFPHGFEVDPD